MVVNLAFKKPPAFATREAHPPLGRRGLRDRLLSTPLLSNQLPQKDEKNAEKTTSATKTAAKVPIKISTIRHTLICCIILLPSATVLPGERQLLQRER
jgi:hypothetical protein